MCTPAITYMTLGYVLAISMIVDAVGSIVTWSGERKAGNANGWHLAAAIVSGIFGIVVLCSTVMQVAVDMFIAYMAAAWIIVMGAIRIALSIRMKKIRNALNAEIIGKRWWLILIAGILMIAFGIFSLINPTALIVTIGVMIGLNIVVSGVNLIAIATA